MMIAKVKNTPEVVKNGWVVARRDDYTAALWYYGTYSTEERAQEVAQELDNAVVLESVSE